MNSTALDMWGFQATVGTAARTARWSATAAAYGSRHHVAASTPLPSAFMVKHNAKGIRHRPPEDFD